MKIIPALLLCCIAAFIFAGNLADAGRVHTAEGTVAAGVVFVLWAGALAMYRGLGE